MRRQLAVWTSMAFLAPFQLTWSEEVAPPDGKPLPELVALNRAALFGPHAEVKEGRVTLRFPPDGSFGRSFLSRSTPQRGFIAEPAERDTVLVRQVLHEVDKQAACAALQAGTALSTFELAEEFNLSFRIKAPNVARGSTVTLRVNFESPRKYIEVANFQTATVLGGKRPIREVTSLPEYRAHWSAWFDRKSKEGVRFQVGLKDGKFSVRMTPPKEGDKEPEPIEIVAVDGIDDPRRGKIVWMFNNVSFALTDLVIEGKYSEDWATNEIARLQKDGQLLLEEPKVAASPATTEKDPESAAPKSERKASGAGGDIDLDKPDPEADEDL